MAGVNETDPRAAARYSVGYAAKLIAVPVSTLRAWVSVRPSPTAGEHREVPALIRQVPAGGLSFMNLVEAYTLAAMRRTYHLKLDKIRAGLAFVEKRLGVLHPLAQQAFKTDGSDLFIEHCGGLLNVSEHGQMVMREAFDGQLEQVEYDDALAERLFPFVRTPPPRG